MSEFFKGFLSREIVSLTVMLAVLLVPAPVPAHA